jgi:hypothetical protein
VTQPGATGVVPAVSVALSKRLHGSRGRRHFPAGLSTCRLVPEVVDAVTLDPNGFLLKDPRLIVRLIEDEVTDLLVALTRFSQLFLEVRSGAGKRRTEIGENPIS